MPQIHPLPSHRPRGAKGTKRVPENRNEVRFLGRGGAERVCEHCRFVAMRESSRPLRRKWRFPLRERLLKCRCLVFVIPSAVEGSEPNSLKVIYSQSAHRLHIADAQTCSDPFDSPPFGGSLRVTTSIAFLINLLRVRKPHFLQAPPICRNLSAFRKRGECVRLIIRKALKGRTQRGKRCPDQQEGSGVPSDHGIPQHLCARNA